MQEPLQIHNLPSPRLCVAVSPRRRRARGASVLEMALVLPVLLMLSLGVVDYGYYFFVKNTVQGAASAGVRAASTPGATNASVTSIISSMMTAAGLQNSGYTVTLTPSDVSTATDGQSVTVTITCTWANCGTHALPAGMGGISNSKQVTGSAVMQKESS